MHTIYRAHIREVLALAHPWWLPERALEDRVKTLAGGSFDLSDYRRAIEWNLEKDYIRSRTNEDTDQTEWKLTKLGEAKQSQ